MSAPTEPSFAWEPVTDRDHYAVCESRRICERAYMRVASMPTSIAHELLRCSECEHFEDSGADA